MKLLLEKTIEHLEAAGQKRRDPDYRQARWHYLKSAEYLFQAAAKSTGPLRQWRWARPSNCWPSRGDWKVRRKSRADALPRSSRSTRDSTDSCSASPPRCDSMTWQAWMTPKSRSDCALIYPLQHPEKARRYGIKRGRGGAIVWAPGHRQDAVGPGYCRRNPSRFLHCQAFRTNVEMGRRV